MEPLTKKSLYSPEVHQVCLSRIEQLTSDTRPAWGQMTAAQMLAHCAEILEVSNGKELRNTPFVVKLFRGLVRKMVVSERPYPKSSRTHPQFKQTLDRDYDTEKKRLLDALERFIQTDEAQRRALVHPLFGRMTDEERGWSMYKHLDHHLTQFGV